MPDDVLSPDPLSAPPPPPEGAAHPAEPAASAPPPTAAEAETPAGAPAPEVQAPAAEAQQPAPKAAEEEPAAETPPAPSNKHWYVVKVQSGREESIKEAIERRVRIEGLEEFFGQIVVPVERVTEVRNGKRVVKTRKLYPGYLMCEVEFNDRILYLFRETSGVGDFVGGTINRPPPPMSDREVGKMLNQQLQPAGAKETPGKAPFSLGDRVRVRDGTFAGMEGEVKRLDEEKGHAFVELTIFGRPVSVELEYWQVEEA
jgi:transcriptional antiterminator NusG